RAAQHVAERGHRPNRGVVLAAAHQRGDGVERVEEEMWPELRLERAQPRLAKIGLQPRGARRLLRRLRPEALDALEEDDEEIEERVDPRVVERDAPERHRRTAGQRPREPALEDRVDPP